MLFNNRSKGCLGVDIGARSLKVLELSRRGAALRVERYAARALPRAAKPDREGGVAALGEALRGLVPPGRGAIVAVPGAAVMLKTIEMDATLGELELESQIAVEADQHIPHPLEEVALDFARLGPSARQPGCVEVLLAACRKEAVDQRVTALALGGLEARVVDIEPHVMERAFGLLREQMELPAARLAAILDAGTEQATLHVLLEGRVVHARDLRFGGLSLNEYAHGSQDSGLPRSIGGRPSGQAPYVTADAGPPLGRDLHGSSPETDWYGSVAEERGRPPADELQGVLDELVEQAVRALRFFAASSPHGEAELLVLAGDLARAPGLGERLGDRLAAPCVVADPFARMTFARGIDGEALHRDAPGLLLASGLALRGL